MHPPQRRGQASIEWTRSLKAPTAATPSVPTSPKARRSPFERTVHNRQAATESGKKEALQLKLRQGPRPTAPKAGRNQERQGGTLPASTKAGPAAQLPHRQAATKHGREEHFQPQPRQGPQPHCPTGRPEHKRRPARIAGAPGSAVEREKCSPEPRSPACSSRQHTQAASHSSLS